MYESEGGGMREKEGEREKEREREREGGGGEVERGGGGKRCGSITELLSISCYSFISNNSGS